MSSSSLVRSTRTSGTSGIGKTASTHYGLGIRQADGEEVAEYADNFALYNAPPGTWQRMAAYFLVSPTAAQPTREAVMSFTHGDQFKPIAGYKTMVNHFHLRFTERQRASGSLDNAFQDLMVMRAAGINIVGLSDFHGDLRGTDTGKGRLEDQRDYALASQKASDKDFLVTPWEEPSVYFGGHYNILFPKNVYWNRRREPNQPFIEDVGGFGKVYHTANAEDVQQMLDAEGGYWFHAHPRTKGTTGYPDAIFDRPYVKNDRYLGVAFKPGMGQDLSEERLCEWRCFDAIDTMNNLYANSALSPKYLIADVDTYRKGPEDDIYPGHPVSYLKIDKLPGPTDDWTPILRALRSGDFWVTTGEVLITGMPSRGRGTGARSWPTSSGRIRSSSSRSYGAMGRRSIAGSCARPTCLRIRASGFPSRSTRPATDGCGLPPGTPPGTAPSCSPSG